MPLKYRLKTFVFLLVAQRVCGQPILLALIVGEAAQAAEARPDADVIGHAVTVLRRLFGPDTVPEPSTTRVTRWGGDRFSRGAYSYVAVGATGKDYDLMAAPVEKALFFAGEATCRVRTSDARVKICYEVVSDLFDNAQVGQKWHTVTVHGLADSKTACANCRLFAQPNLIIRLIRSRRTRYNDVCTVGM